MPLPVSLQKVIDEMDSQNEMITAYINRKTGELTIVTEELEMELEWVESEEYDTKMEDLSDWLQKALPKIKEAIHSEDFITLPSPYEIHEYAIMRDFCHTVEDPDIKKELLMGIDGRGAFRMFKDLIFRHNIRDDWFDYKNEALKKIAINFLDEREIPYKDDCR